MSQPFIESVHVASHAICTDIRPESINLTTLVIIIYSKVHVITFRMCGTAANAHSIRCTRKFYRGVTMMIASSTATALAASVFTDDGENLLDNEEYHNATKAHEAAESRRLGLFVRIVVVMLIVPVTMQSERFR